MQDILRHLETQHANFAALSENGRSGAAPSDSGIVDLVKRELSDIRFSQSEAGRHTQDSLEAVHNTLGHVVDRLAMIEGDLRAVRTQPAAPQPETPPAPAYVPPQAAAPRVAMAPQPKPELPNPVAAPERNISPRRHGNFMPPRRRRHKLPPPRRKPSAKFWCRRSRALRSSRICRPIIRLSPAQGRAHGWLRRPSASRLPKTRSAAFRQARARRSARRVSSPPRAAPPRPPQPHRRTPKAAAAQPSNPPTVRPRKRPPSPPRFARCWWAQAWS